MGTTIEAWAVEHEALRQWFERVEDVCSRFRPGSELSSLNGTAASAVVLEGILLDVIEAGSRARDMTGGLVDIGVGSAVESWGYDRSFETLTQPAHAPDPVDQPMWRLKGKVLRRSPGVRFDLGGIAKGWCCDRAVDRGLAEVVSAGGDLRSSHPDTTASILDPGGEIVARVHVGRGALATSSIGKRRWRVGDRCVNHIIDPRTMEPVHTPVVSASVLADTAADAEIGAKAVLLLGADGLAWASEQGWIAAALVIWHDGSVFGTPDLEVVA